MNMYIAAVERLECVPMSSGINLSLSFLILPALARNASRMSFWINSSNFPSSKYVQIDVSVLFPGY